jgi:N-acyl homoserine lactone hydrolase
MSKTIKVSKAVKEKHRIRPLVITEVEAPMPCMTYLAGFGEMVTIDGYIWHIEGPKENIIVDTGGKAETALGFQAKDVQSPENALGKLGLKCEDIDIVILTHLHSDHFDYAGKFKNARFIVQRDELDYARNPHPLMQCYYQPILNLLDEVNFEVLDGDEEIVRGVKVLLTPGHSQGSQSVAIETEKGIAVITGFCCVNENFIEGIWPVTPPTIHVNATQAYDSMLKVKEIADIIIPLHESTFAKKEVIP